MANTNETLRVDYLAIENFRGFNEIELKLHPQLTVFVAENSQGKTALLDAIAIALEPFVSVQLDEKQMRGIGVNDMRVSVNEKEEIVPTGFTHIGMDGTVNGKRLGWSRSRSNWTARGRTSSEIVDLLNNAKELRELANTDSSDRGLLPVVVFYGTARAINLAPPKKGDQWSFGPTAGPEVGYWDYYRPSSTFDSFVEWYRHHMDILRHSSHTSTDTNKQSLNFLTSVNQTVETLLSPTEWCHLAWDYSVDNHFTHDALTIKNRTSNVRLPLRALSDGVRNVLALAADLTHRCVRLNPHLGLEAATKTPGVVMIDEIDLHLHPS